jgi:MFS family permease
LLVVVVEHGPFLINVGCRLKPHLLEIQLWFQNETGICRGLCNAICLICTPPLTRGLTQLLALACGLAVATVYLSQPLLESMAGSLGIAQAQVGLVVGATQAGYAAGLLLIVPLGDLFARKRLILTQLVLAAVALLAVASSLDWAMLLAAMGMVGLMAVVVQVMVAHAATLATPRNRGKRWVRSPAVWCWASCWHAWPRGWWPIWRVGVRFIAWLRALPC